MGAEVKSYVDAACTHCGDACGTDALQHAEQPFCCAGCVSVYQILREHNLLDFYAIDADAGQKQDKAKSDYAWLDVPKLAERVVSYREETRWQVSIELPAIHCASCLWLLERLPHIFPAVYQCRVDFGRKRANIAFDPTRLSFRQLAEHLAAIGYPPHFSGKAAEEAPRPDRSTMYRIGVAGFCFGNIMLLSFPEYFGLSAALGADAGARAGWMEAMLRYLLLGLSLPVLFYAGVPFLTGAREAFKARRVTIDVPIVIGMVALFGRSLYEIVASVGPGYLDSFSGLVFFLLIGRWFQSNTFDRLNFDREYEDYFPIAAYRESPAGQPEAVASADLQVGDVLLVRPGQIIPADGTLLNEKTCSIDYAFVTGEAEPKASTAGQSVFAGGRATAEALKIAVTKTADQSYLLGLWRDSANTREEEPVAPSEKLISAFTIGLLLIAASTFVYWVRADPSVAYRAAVAVLIIACPCALALAAPFAYGTLQRLLAGHGYYFRSSASLKRLLKTTTYVFDKTGTLTQSQQAYELDFMGGEVVEHTQVALGLAAQSSHPKSRVVHALLSEAKPGLRPANIGGVREVTGQGLLVEFQGRVYRLGSADFCGLAEKGTYLTVDGEPYLKLNNTTVRLRPGISELLGKLDRPEETWLISGDNQPEGAFWDSFFARGKSRFEQSPFEKLRLVERLQSDGKFVLMVGDGLNDAGALRAANVGLAVNEHESTFNPACDGIVQADKLPLLAQVLKVGQRLRFVLWATYGLAFAYNLIGLSYAVTGTLSPVIAAVLMPVSSISIVVFATLGAHLVEKMTKVGE